MANQEQALDLSCDDVYSSALFSAMDEDDDVDEFCPVPISDVMYAEVLQFQEALMSSIMANKSQNSEQVEGVGESSLSFCEICVERKESDQIFKVENCKHFFCNDCISKHVEARLEYNITHTIACPAVNCEGVIEFGSCTSILPKDILEKWDGMLCESLIQESQKFYCPFKDCSTMLVKDADEVIRESECPLCYRLFCAQCSVPWHASVGCEEFQSLNADERTNEDLLLKGLAGDNNWKRCPHCKYYIEKTQGCLHMTCRCRFQFCYACGGTWTASHGGCQPPP